MFDPTIEQIGPARNTLSCKIDRSQPRLPYLLPESGAARSPLAGEKLMAAGVRDRVVMSGMGCTTFGERWETPEALMVEAFQEALADAGIERNQMRKPVSTETIIGAPNDRRSSRLSRSSRDDQSARLAVRRGRGACAARPCIDLI